MKVATRNSGEVTQGAYAAKKKTKKRLVLWAKQQAPVVQKVDNAIHLIYLYLVENAMGFPNNSRAR